MIGFTNVGGGGGSIKVTNGYLENKEAKDIDIPKNTFIENTTKDGPPKIEYNVIEQEIPDLPIYSLSHNGQTKVLYIGDNQFLFLSYSETELYFYIYRKGNNGLSLVKKSSNLISNLNCNLIHNIVFDIDENYAYILAFTNDPNNSNYLDYIQIKLLQFNYRNFTIYKITLLKELYGWDRYGAISYGSLYISLNSNYFFYTGEIRPSGTSYQIEIYGSLGNNARVYIYEEKQIAINSNLVEISPILWAYTGGEEYDAFIGSTYVMSSSERFLYCYASGSRTKITPSSSYWSEDIYNYHQTSKKMMKRYSSDKKMISVTTTFINPTKNEFIVFNKNGRVEEKYTILATLSTLPENADRYRTYISTAPTFYSDINKNRLIMIEEYGVPRPDGFNDSYQRVVLYEEENEVYKPIKQKDFIRVNENQHIQIDNLAIIEDTNEVYYTKWINMNDLGNSDKRISYFLDLNNRKVTISKISCIMPSETKIDGLTKTKCTANKSGEVWFF